MRLCHHIPDRCNILEMLKQPVNNAQIYLNVLPPMKLNWCLRCLLYQGLEYQRPKTSGSKHTLKNVKPSPNNLSIK